MAQIVATGAAFIGNQIAPGIGGAIGWIVGSLIGNMLFPPDSQNIQGPRLGDLQVTSSAFGSVRGRGFGTIRQAGSMIWSTGLIEEPVTVSSGGKGGGGPEVNQTTYPVFSSFAIAFGEGPAEDVIRMWADGKLIYDRTGSNIEVCKKGLNFRFYKGTEDQVADSVIEADKGVGNVPAFRGTIYLVFERLPLADFGNHVPNITAEIAYLSTSALTVDVATTIGTPLATQTGAGFAIDWDRGRAYTTDVIGGVNLQGIRRYNIFSMVEDRQVTSAEMLDQVADGTANPGGPMVVLKDGSIVIQINTVGGTNAEPLVRLDGTSMRETARDGLATTLPLNFTPDTFALVSGFAANSLVGMLGVEQYIIMRNGFGDICLAHVNEFSINYLWNAESIIGGTGSSRTLGVAEGLSVRGECEFHATTGPNYGLGASANNVKVWRFGLLSGASYSLLGGEFTPTGVDADVVKEFTVAELVPGETTLINAGEGLVYDPLDNSVIFSVTASTGSQDYLIKVDSATGDIVWRTAVGNAPNDGRYWSMSRLRGTTFAFMIGDKAYLVDTRDGELLLNGTTFGTTHPVGSPGAFDGCSDTWVGQTGSGSVGRWFINRNSGDPAVVSDVITTICGIVNLQAADIDVTDQTDDLIPGYLLGSQMSARGALQPLAQSYFFDAVESDYKIKFVERGGSSVRTIPQEDLGFADARTGEITKESRIQEVELPERFTVTYMDRDTDYQQGSQYAKRLRLPTPSQFSRNQLGYNIAAAFTATFAKQIAEKSLFTSWAERVSREMMWSWEHVDLDPTDVVTLMFDDGTTEQLRLVSTDIGVPFNVDVTGVHEETNQYSSTVIGDNGDGAIPVAVPGAGVTKLLLLDSPLLRDGDEPAGRATIPTYFFQGGYGQGGWRGARLYKSTDGGAYAQIGRTTSEMSWGSTTNTLGDPPGDNPFATDDVNTLTVAMTASSDPLVSVTELEMLNGANAAMLIKANGEVEVIQYQTVVDNGNSTYTLSTLLRGRRGTDTMSFTHTLGEAFLLLQSVDGDTFQLSLTEKDAQRFYRSVGVGDFLEDTETNTKTSVGRALMPYHPAQQDAIIDGGNNLDLNWVRRTRIGGGLQGGTGSVPVSEDTEEYELEIYDGPAGSLIRTVTGLTTETYQYTSANQSGDGLSPPLAALTYKVFQVSAQVGRGFSREITVDVE